MTLLIVSRHAAAMAALGQPCRLQGTSAQGMVLWDQKGVHHEEQDVRDQSPEG